MVKTAKTNAKLGLRGSKKRDAFFDRVEENFEVFSFAKPDDLPDDERANVRLCKGDILRGTVQILPKGFSNTLHYHPAAEGFWMVLSGGVRFYGKDARFLGEFGPLEGVLVPRNGRYWFHQFGDKEAHLLQVKGNANDGSKNRVDVDEIHTEDTKQQIYSVYEDRD